MKNRWFDVLSVVLAVLAAVLILFFPIILLSMLGTWMILGSTAHATGATVGIGVILRATARRLLRSGARNVLQTTVGTFTRTTARAITRRVVRVAIKSFTLVVKEAIMTRKQKVTVDGAPDQVEGGDVSEEPVDDDEPIVRQHPLVAILLGFAGLYLSLLGILYFIWTLYAPVARVELELGTVMGTSPMAPLHALPVAAGLSYEPELGGLFSHMSIFLAALLGAIPILVYALLIFLAARLCRVQATFQTGADGLLLQAYFTGSLSFLPLTTDVQYDGTVKDASRVAMISLAGMYVVHLLLLGLAYLQASSVLHYASTMFLLYCFVYSFPIKPLDGQYLWARSKLLWLIFWIPILGSFIFTIPEDFNAIL